MKIRQKLLVDMRQKNLSITTLIALLFLTQVSFAQDNSVLGTIIKLVSPVETSDLIKKLGIQYDRSILNDPMNIANYKTDSKKALNLGIYSTDLGYANINAQSQDALTYLNSVKKTADGLELGQFIDFGKILKLAANRDALNELLDETSTTFENISTHLEANGKSDLAALILTGGWLETLHITCEVATKTEQEELKTKVIEQKFILEQIIPILDKFKGSEMTSLSSQLKELNKLFSKYKFGDSASAGNVEVVGEIVVVGSENNGGKEVEVSKEDVVKISNKVKEIRNEIIK